MSDTKICKLCGGEFPRESFYKLTGKQYKATWDCRDSLCIQCRGKYVSNRRKDIKKLCVEFLGGKCIDCKLETTHYCVYDFHHEGNKDFSISDRPNLSFDRLKPELNKCVLLCSNCHRIRHEK